jgi:hypothetical protein
MSSFRHHANDSRQYSLPLGLEASGGSGDSEPSRASKGQSISRRSGYRDEESEYSLGVFVVCKGRPPVTFDSSNRFRVLDMLTPHIGRRSALLLEMFGYHSLTDLVRTGCHLSGIPSIGPRKTEKILRLVEGFGLSPLRQPSAVPERWRALFDQLGQ